MGYILKWEIISNWDIIDVDRILLLMYIAGRNLQKWEIISMWDTNDVHRIFLQLYIVFILRIGTSYCLAFTFVGDIS